MGQELVKYGSATDLVKRLDQDLVGRAPTVNQQRLREMLTSGECLEQSRFYHPPATPADQTEWASESANPITVASQEVAQVVAIRSSDPKACFTGFAFGIACAGAIGGAFFLSFATVVTPQPSVAALVPVELGNRSVQQAFEIPQERRTAKSEANPDHHSTWQRLTHFHASAGKFSQPGIRLASSPDADERRDGIERTKVLAKQKQARLGPQARNGFTLVSTETSDTPVNQNNATVEVRLINVLAEKQAPTTFGGLVNATQREHISIDKRARRPVSVMDDQDTPDLADDTAREPANHPETTAGAEPITKGPVASANNSTKVIRSSLTPTARTKVRLPDRYSTSIARARRLRNAEKSKARAKPGVFAVQKRPDWARAAFRSTGN